MRRCCTCRASSAWQARRQGRGAAGRAGRGALAASRSRVPVCRARRIAESPGRINDVPGVCQSAWPRAWPSCSVNQPPLLGEAAWPGKIVRFSPICLLETPFPPPVCRPDDFVQPDLLAAPCTQRPRQPNEAPRVSQCSSRTQDSGAALHGCNKMKRVRECGMNSPPRSASRGPCSVWPYGPCRCWIAVAR